MNPSERIASSASVHDAIRLLEERLLEAEMQQSAPALSELLAEEFREFGSSGSILHRNEILCALRPGGAFELTMQNFLAQFLSDDVAHSTYTAIAHHLETGRISHSLRSSIWRRRGDRWQLVFHQGTRIPDPSPTP